MCTLCSSGPLSKSSCLEVEFFQSFPNAMLKQNAIFKTDFHFCFRDLFSLVGILKKLVPRGFFDLVPIVFNKPLHFSTCISQLPHQVTLHFSLSLWFPRPLAWFLLTDLTSGYIQQTQ